MGTLPSSSATKADRGVQAQIIPADLSEQTLTQQLEECMDNDTEDDTAEATTSPLQGSTSPPTSTTYQQQIPRRQHGDGSPHRISEAPPLEQQQFVQQIAGRQHQATVQHTRSIIEYPTSKRQNCTSQSNNAFSRPNGSVRTRKRFKQAEDITVDGTIPLEHMSADNGNTSKRRRITGKRAE